MPLEGFTCPPGTPTHGTRNTLEHCLGGCPHPCVAPPLLLAMWEAERANHHQGAYISASMLAGSGCARQTVFERRHPFFDHPQRRYWAFRGTHAHSIIERGEARLAEFGWVQELRMAVPLTYPDQPAPVFDEAGEFTGTFDETKRLTILIGGTCDAYHPRSKTLVDFKTMADAKAEMFVRGEKGGELSDHIDDKWIWQLNIYRWLLAKTPTPPELRERLGVKSKYLPAPTTLMIQGIAMMHIPRSGGTWSLKNKYKQLEAHDIPDVPVLALSDTERFVREQALRWYRYLVLKETPPVVSRREQWLCRNCVFNGELIPGERCHPDAERALLQARTPLVDDLDEP